MLTSGAHVRQVCTALTSTCVAPATLPQGNRRLISRDPAGAGSQRTQNILKVPVVKLHASATADQAPASMAAQVNADSKIPIQELVDLAVVWASQHGLVCNSSLTVINKTTSTRWRAMWVYKLNLNCADHPQHASGHGKLTKLASKAYTPCCVDCGSRGSRQAPGNHPCATDSLANTISTWQL